jgi:hypothetical protein
MERINRTRKNGQESGKIKIGQEKRETKRTRRNRTSKR